MADSLEVDGRTLRVSNLDKVLYPDTGFTKSDVISYLVHVAPLLVGGLQDRPLTRKRWPDGVSSHPFFEKNLPRGAPDWVRRVTLASPGSSRDRETLTYPLIDDTAGLVWLGNLAALELHVPQWRVDSDGRKRDPDRLVIDLDPGPGTGLAECAALALRIREALVADGLEPVPVTSGSKGLQLYATVSGDQPSDVLRAYAHRLAVALERETPDHVVSRMTKSLREGRVLLDWSQNNEAKTTIAPYSLRGRDQPWVAAPRTWAELGQADGLTQLLAGEVLERIGKHGDLVSGLRVPGPRVPEGR